MKPIQISYSKNRTAFTMLELVFVIIVLGILSSLAIPRFDRDLRQEAASNILSDIRYTQHMALVDDVTNPFKPNWQRAFWRIGFNNCEDSSGLYEYIGSDKDLEGNIDNNEAAIDPLNGKKMNWSGAKCSDGGNNASSNRIFLTHKYNVTSLETSGGCPVEGAQYIGFDNLGRLHQGFAGSGSTTSPLFESYLDSDCNLTFHFKDNVPAPFSIIIKKETGYAYIDGQPDS